MEVIIPAEGYLDQLRSLTHDAVTLESYSFVIQPLTKEKLLLKRRCQGCGKAMSQLDRDEKTSKDASKAQIVDKPNVTTALSPSQIESKPGEDERVHIFRCKYHPGLVLNKHWTCCFQHVSGTPCGGTDTHIPHTQPLRELVALYQYHPTPTTDSIPGGNIRAAVAMDCEMGTALSGDSELIRVTVIDYFSGAVLVNNMVEPDVPMSHLNTRFSGVSWADIRNAKKQGTCLAGKASARSAVWNYVGPETIVIGHGVSNDLRALRWIHTLILDSFVMESSHTKIHENDASKTIDGEVKEDNGSDDLIARMERSTVSGLQVTAEATTTPGQKKRRGSPGRLSLKTLVNKYLDVDIQTAGKKGHDSLEDAVAARNLVHWMITESKRTCCGARP